MAREIAFYGKGGIGKSTVACNIAGTLAESGHRVMQVGCSPKVDSTAFLLGGEPPDHNILQYTREHGVSKASVMDTIVQGYRGVYCVESGGPEPAEGCAGRGVTLALDLLKRYSIYGELELDFVLYDVIADVVCGGFGQPMRAGYAREVYLITSGELMSLYSSNNICRAIATVASTNHDVRVAGLIDNQRNVQRESELVEAFGEMIGVPVLAHIPRSDLVQKAEGRSGTVIQVFPTSREAQIYRGLAAAVAEPKERFVPEPLELEQILDLLRQYEAFD
jgi:nitrogenase iron protein NifH